MQIGEVAQSTGLSIDTIRFYEKQNLIPRPARTSGRYRTFSDMDVERLRFIGRAQNLGFTLHEIRELLVIEGSDGGCSHVRDLVAAKIRQVREKIAELRKIEMRLAKAKKLCSAALMTSCKADCPVIEELESGRNWGKK